MRRAFGQGVPGAIVHGIHEALGSHKIIGGKFNVERIVVMCQVDFFCIEYVIVNYMVISGFRKFIYRLIV